MKRYELKKEYGPSGAAMVTVGKKTVGVLMQETHVKYELPFDSVPEILQGGRFKNGLLRVAFSDDNTSIIGVSPWEGRVFAKVKDFGGQAGMLPTPKRDQSPGHNKQGQEYARDFLKFGANLDITGPDDMKGMTGYAPFIYYDKKRGGFAPDPETGTMVALVGKNRDVQKLDAFLQAVGLGELEMPWSDNILPALLALILKKDREFGVTFEKGWPVSYEAIPQESKSVKRRKAVQKAK